MKDISLLLARLLMAVIFVFEAYDTLYYKADSFVSMEAYGVRLDHGLVFYGALTVLTLGSIMLILGYRLGIASFLLLLYLVPYTLIVHDFWKLDNPIAHREQSIHFMKNLAIIGALIVLSAGNVGRYALKRILASTRS
jgi:putative oxidoreductase